MGVRLGIFLRQNDMICLNDFAELAWPDIWNRGDLSIIFVEQYFLVSDI